MQECCAIERPDGNISVSHINWTRYATDPSMLTIIHRGNLRFRKWIVDIQEHFIWEIVKQPHIMGRSFKFHELWNYPRRNFDLERAYRLARDRPFLVMDAASLPPKNIRRDAWRFNPGFTDLMDDKSITTKLEVMIALRWHQTKLIASGSLVNPTLRKIAWGRFDALGPEEVDPYVLEWRVGGDAPECSRFIPSRDALPIPAPAEFIGGS